MRLKWLVLFAVSLPCLADTGLDSLRASLLALRDKPIDSGGPRGAVPQLTIVKHQLRDLVESRFKGFTRDFDEGLLERELNAELLYAKLFCGYYGVADRPPCPDWSLFGFLKELKLHRSGIFLVLKTGVGIACGYDESAYLYTWSDEGRRRVCQT
jgi:hypothetical protein